MSIKDKVAIVGVGATPYTRDARMSAESLAARAARSAILDAGLEKHQIDGICGGLAVPAYAMQSALGISEVRWYENPAFPPASQFLLAAHAIACGACETVLCYHAGYRASGTSRSASADPIRSRSGAGMNVPGATPDVINSAAGYAAWTSRYMHEFGATREDLGRIAINARTHACGNPHALMRTPLSMAEYLDSRMVREPLSMLDMDYPVDGADAFVLTTVERARDLRARPILIHAASVGQVAPAEPDQLPSLQRVSPDIVAPHLWAASDIGISDVDLLYPYDGFTIIPIIWLEALGLCARGEGPALLRSSWNEAAQRLEFGRMLLSTHGGSLSEGGVQGIGLFREAVDQLRGDQGVRQAYNASIALVAPGGFVAAAGAFLLRAAD
jgi:acetyl-CoA acetyltransferase